MTPQELQRRHIRRSQYVSCNDAFIDVRLPGSNPKENYSIIGPGVTQNASQVINLRMTERRRRSSGCTASCRPQAAEATRQGHEAHANPEFDVRRAFKLLIISISMKN